MIWSVCLVLGMALAACFAWSIALKRDIRRLGRRLGEISQADTNARLTTRTSDKDVAALAESVNLLLERVRREQIDNARREAELKRAITNISHDLRTPLTSALGYLQMLEALELGDEVGARYLKTARGRLEALSAQMNSLFEFAGIIEGNVAFDIRRVNIGSALRDALSAGYEELAAGGFAVDASIPDVPVFCLCDAGALGRVLQNLIKNVCVHGKEYLRVRQEGGVIEFANKTGRLAELDPERLFERFYTADASRSGKNTGLGLAIARELVTRMGGRITAVVEDGLLILRLELPLCDAHEAAIFQ